MGVILFQTLYAQKTENKIIVDVNAGKNIISRHVYGHFAEHLGHGIYGGIWVGEESNIPNTRGIRNDVVVALKEIAVPNVRWPGGCFADEYHWMDGIGPRSQRPVMINTHWGGVTEDNSFGTHEFMDFCEQLGCEPVITGNLGSGTVREMSQWIEYLTSDNVSPMTNLRKENGHEKPWLVKYWGIGNENWGCGGQMTAQFYADQMRRYSTYCRNYHGNELYRIACGPSDQNYDWMETLMKEKINRNCFQGISLHYYTICHNWTTKGSAVNFDESEWFQTMIKTRKMEEFINKHSEIMDRYDPEKQIGLIVDEWGTWYDNESDYNPGFLYQQNTLRDALVAAVNLNIFNNHCDRVKMANIAQMVNVLQAVILTKENQIVLTPTYYVYKMYKVHQDATLLPIELTCENYKYLDDSVPALSASASIDKQGVIHITLTNLNPTSNLKLTCDFKGKTQLSVNRSEIISANKMNSYNDFGKPEEVGLKKFSDLLAKKNSLSINLPARSAVMVELIGN
ncbi:MAG: alpha-L-arabinofuranosidase C-terminal domain-containing protein [Candidatus Neomarinimicrobiota bacterium]